MTADSKLKTQRSGVREARKDPKILPKCGVARTWSAVTSFCQPPVRLAL